MKLHGWALVMGALACSTGMAACGGDEEESAGGGGGGDQAAQDTSPIVIGAAIDQTDFMSSFDGPALAAAQIQAEKINAAGGVNGRKITFEVQNTQLKPDRTRSAAIDLAGKADVLWVTCDVDLSTPSIQVGISQKKLVVAPCIGTDQMGPKRFGEAGKLAFSFGNVAQDEGAALAKMAWDKGWKTANVVTDKALVYTQNVCTAFSNRFKELGGTIAAQESFSQGDGTIRRVVSKVGGGGGKADVNALCTVPGKDLSSFVSGVRGLGNDTPIAGPWSIDGAFWLPKSPKAADNLYWVTFASVFGDDPDPKVQELIDEMKAKGSEPATGGFVTGAAAVDAIAAAVEKNGGSTDGEKLATTFEGFKDLETISGAISFSPEFHTAFGREYRVIEVQDGKPKLSGTVEAGTPAAL